MMMHVSLRCLVVSTPLNTTQSCPGMSSGAVAVLLSGKIKANQVRKRFYRHQNISEWQCPCLFCDVAAAVQTGETPSGWIAARCAGVLENNAILLSLMAFWCFLWRIPKEMDGNGGCIWVWGLGWCVCNGHQHSPLFNLGKPFCLLEMVPDWQLSSERKSRGQLVRAKVGAFFFYFAVFAMSNFHIEQILPILLLFQAAAYVWFVKHHKIMTDLELHSIKISCSSCQSEPPVLIISII